MRLELLLASLLTFAAASAPAQWQILDAHTTASLRGVHNVGNGIIWASGTNGTVLRSIDDGKSWTTCTTPPDAAKLDFRGIQAFDANTAIVMSSGKGDLSRLYKTTDGCKTWELLFTNPDKDGFFDALVANQDGGIVVGDPVDRRFAFFASTDRALQNWRRFGERSAVNDFRIDFRPNPNEGLYAASNSVLAGDESSHVEIAAGGEFGGLFYSFSWREHGMGGFPQANSFTSNMKLAKGATAGAFSFAARQDNAKPRERVLIAVGGDYKKPNDSSGTASFTRDGGIHWTSATTSPHGYRSAVAYDASTKTWITVGPNGTDISTDDGRNWRPLKPSASEAPDTDQNWNALSLPFVVGPHGRIGKLRSDALPSPKP